MHDSSSMFRHNYQTSSVGNTISNGDIEFIDPAILAVGKGLLPGSVNNSGLDDARTHYSSQLSAYEEAKFQSILQRSVSSHQNHRFTNTGESFSLGDAYGIPSRVVEQTLANNISPLSQFGLPQSRNGIISNGQWDGWNELQAGNNLGMAEMLRNERLGFNKFYGSYEDSKMRMPSSDTRLQGKFPIRGLYQALAVASMCIQEQVAARPLISDVVTALSYLANQSYDASLAPGYSNRVAVEKDERGGKLLRNEEGAESGRNY